MSSLRATPVLFASTANAKWHGATPSVPQDVLGVGVIGAGRIGRVHMSTLRSLPDVRIVGVADFFESAATSAGKQCNCAWTTDWQTLVSHPSVRAVIVCSPSGTHCDIIRACAAAGKDVFCEKPIDHKLERIDAALRDVQAARILLQVGFQRRFDADFARARAAVQKGDVGEPRMLSIVSRDPAPPPIEYVRTSGGLFFDMMVHDFDMARFVLGDEIVEVTARAASFDKAISDAGDVTSAVVVLKFAGGAMGTIQCCREAPYGYDQRLEVLGSKGAVDIENRFGNSARIWTKEGVARDAPMNFFMDRYGDAFRAEMVHFVKCIRTRSTPLVTGNDGRVPIVVAYAAALSLREGRSVLIREIEEKSGGRARL